MTPTAKFRDELRLAAIEERVKKPATNWKQLTTKDVPWLIRQLRKALDA